MKRLNKFLAECGVASRRKCDLLIQQGRVTVDGKTVQSLGLMIDEHKAVVTVDGRKVSTSGKYVYILLNKPEGYVTTADDELGRKTVMDLIPKDVRVFPVGRLDKDTTGALLLTNDGELAYRLTHPKFEVEKTYQVTLFRPISKRHIEKLRTGIMLEDGMAKPSNIKIFQDDNKKLELTLKEGRKREIRRMFQALGYRISALTRTRFATLTLEGLKVGKWRFLKLKEINKLKTIIPSEI